MAQLQLLHTTRQHTHKQKSCILKVWEEGCSRVDEGGRFKEIKKRGEEKWKRGEERQVGGGMTHC